MVGRLCAIGLVALALPACGLGDKQHRADAIIDSTKAAFAQHSALGTISVSMKFLRIPDGAGAVLGNAGGGGSSASGAQAQQQIEQTFKTVVALDLDHDQGRGAVPSHPTAPFAIYDDLVSFGRRWSASPRDARPWVRVDSNDLTNGEKLDPIQDIPTFATFALNPVLLVDLIAGPLAGSVKTLGTEKVGDVATTHYQANFDFDKVMRNTRRSRFPEDRRKAIEDVLDVLAVSGKVHEGDVWIDAKGLPRQFTLRLKEEPIKHFEIEHTITLDLSSFGEDATQTIPTARERIDVRSVVQFLRATIPSPQTPEFLTFLGVEPPS